jgi:hypothetical protein
LIQLASPINIAAIISIALTRYSIPLLTIGSMKLSFLRHHAHGIQKNFKKLILEWITNKSNAIQYKLKP